MAEVKSSGMFTYLNRKATYEKYGNAALLVVMAIGGAHTLGQIILSGSSKMLPYSDGSPGTFRVNPLWSKNPEII